jgi:hypothetical protein
MVAKLLPSLNGPVRLAFDVIHIAAATPRRQELHLGAGPNTPRTIARGLGFAYARYSNADSSRTFLLFQSGMTASSNVKNRLS